MDRKEFCCEESILRFVPALIILIHVQFFN